MPEKTPPAVAITGSDCTQREVSDRTSFTFGYFWVMES